jgi:fatty acid desaturase
MDYAVDYSLADANVTEYIKSSKPSAMRTVFDVLVLCWAPIIVSLGLYLAAPSIWTYALVFFVVSSRMNGCLTLAHDAWHTSLMPSRKWNDFFGGWLCSYPFGSVYGSARAGHLAHHKYLGTEKDPDSDFIGHFGRHMFVGQLIIMISSQLFGRKTAQMKAAEETYSEEKQAAKSKGLPEMFNVVVMQAIIGSTLWALSGHFWTYFLVWFFPIVTLGTLCYFIRAFGDHARLASDPPGPQEGRLITFAHQLAWERAFLSPFEFNYHAEHHLFASVPHQHLPKLHGMVKDKEGYLRQVIVRNNYTAFLAAYIKQVRSAPGAVAGTTHAGSAGACAVAATSDLAPDAPKPLSASDT